METWDAIWARRNARQYADQPIARENLERVPDRSGLTGRPAATADHQAQSPTFDEVVHWNRW